jgi:hypothetical protein
MFRIISVRQAAVEQPAPQPMPEETAGPQKLRPEMLEERLAPAGGTFLKIEWPY